MGTREESTEPTGFDHLRQAARLLGEKLFDDERTLHHLHAAIAADDLTDSERAAATAMLAECRKDVGEYEEALQLFEKAFQLDPDFPNSIDAHSSAGDICFAADDRRGAVRHYRAALAIDRNDSSAPDWLVCLAVAMVGLEEPPSGKLLDEALDLLSEALAMLTTPDAKEKYVLIAPYERAVLQCRSTRASLLLATDTRQGLFNAEAEFRAAEEYAVAHLGPDIGREDLEPLYEGWIKALMALDRPDDAKRVAEHAERQLR